MEWWFGVLLALALAVGMAAGYRLRASMARRESGDLASVVAERTLRIAQQTADLETLFHADEELERSDRLDDVLQALVDIAVERLGADKSCIFCLDQRRERLVMRVARGFSPAFRDLFSVAPTAGVTGHVLQTGEPVLVEDALNDPRRAIETPAIADAALSEGVRSFMFLPIRLADGVFAVFNASYNHPHAFTERDQRLFSALAQRASIAIERAQNVDRERRRADQLDALRETARAVAGTLDLDALLTLIIEQATALLSADGGLVNLVDWQLREDEVVAATGMATAVLGTRNPLEAGLSGWVALHNQPVISNDIIGDSRTAQAARTWVADGGVQCAAVAPLTVKAQIIGTLAMVGTGEAKRCFVQDDLDLLVAFADQAAVAIDNARLYRKAQELAAEQERVRLARELHDAVTQNLFSASLIADILPAALTADPNGAQELLEQLRQLCRGALAEMRTLLLELRPAALAEAKLPDLLKHLSEALSGRTGLPVQFRVDPAPELPIEVRIALYRIAQEALNNVIKHAQATRVTLELACLSPQTGGQVGAEPAADTGAPPAGGVRLTIEDDGQGFDTAALPAAHLGLRNIRERGQSIGAVVEVRSGPGRGTQVNVTWCAGQASGAWGERGSEPGVLAGSVDGPGAPAPA